MPARRSPDTRKQTNTKLLPATRGALEELAEGAGLPLGTYIARVLEAHVEGEPAGLGQGAPPPEGSETLDQVVELFADSRQDTRALREDIEGLRGELRLHVRLLLGTILDSDSDPDLVIDTWKKVVSRSEDPDAQGG